MADRDLPALLVVRALQHLSCEASIEGGYIVVVRRHPGGAHTAKQHLHKGEKDTLRRQELRRLYWRRLRFTREEFYAAVDAVK